MTGFVRAYKPEMKIKHYEEYRGVYCSLCRALGKRYGLIARLILSYDFTFFALLLMCTDEKKVCFEQKRCPFNPTKKCNFCKESTALAYAADVAILTAYYKILDNIEDDGFFGKILMYIIKPLFSFYHKKAARYAPEADRIIAELMKKQKAIEEGKTGNIDESAGPTAEAMAKLISAEFSDGEKRIFERIGYMLGRWVYITDAFYDREKDRKKGSYNPFNINEKSEKEIKAMLNITVGEMISAYELLNVRQFDEVIRNVLFEGLYHIAQNGGERKNEKSI